MPEVYSITNKSSGDGTGSLQFISSMLYNSLVVIQIPFRIVRVQNLPLTRVRNADVGNFFMSEKSPHSVFVIFSEALHNSGVYSAAS